jgi:hypothetical protein
MAAAIDATPQLPTTDFLITLHASAIPLEIATRLRFKEGL